MSSSFSYKQAILFSGFLGIVEAQSTSYSAYGATGTQFNSSMAIIIVVLICVFFLMGFLSIYLRQCSDRDEPSLARWAPRRHRGLDATAIAAFPKLVYADVKDHKLGKGALECAICLSEFEEEDCLRLLPKCDHVFHPECIDSWLASHATCPVCRADLAAEDANVVLPDPVTSPEHVAVSVEEGRAPRLSRSKSTGHSIVIVHAEDCDRFTLRLPEQVRRDVMEGKMRRSTSFAVLPQQGEGSSRGGRSFKRWSFFSKTLSMMSPRREDGPGEGSKQDRSVRNSNGPFEKL